MYFHEFFKQLTEEETNLIFWTEQEELIVTIVFDYN